MKKRLISIIILVCLVSLFVCLLNLELTTSQGINYELSTKRIPLYLKAGGFLYRHFSYQQLVKEIIDDAKSDKQKILAIFKWTHENIRQNIPKDYPIVDDHVFNIIIRLYGTHDQSQDVFTALCTYAGFRAFWIAIGTDDVKPMYITVSLVQLDGRWLVFDSFRGNYFLNDKEEIASVEDIRKDLRICSNLVGLQPFIESIDYKKYFVNLENPVKDIAITRAERQMPGKMFLHMLKKTFRLL
ncbi:hypothetical protein ACFL1I_03450 [Candidatus Omnitrophota bacterium]